jgi:hypothetical protein
MPPPTATSVAQGSRALVDGTGRARPTRSSGAASRSFLSLGQEPAAGARTGTGEEPEQESARPRRGIQPAVGPPPLEAPAVAGLAAGHRRPDGPRRAPRRYPDPVAAAGPGLLWARWLDPLEESCFQTSPHRHTAGECHRWCASQPRWFLAATKGPFRDWRRLASTRGWPHDSWPREIRPARAVPRPGSPRRAG